MHQFDRSVYDTSCRQRNITLTFVRCFLFQYSLQKDVNMPESGITRFHMLNYTSPHGSLCRIWWSKTDHNM